MPCLVEHGPGVDRQPDHPIIVAHDLHLEIVAPAVFGQKPQEFQPIHLPDLDAGKKIPPLGQHIRDGGIPQDTGQGRIAGYHAALGIELENALGRMLENIPVLGLAFDEFPLHAPVGRDIPARGLIFGQAAGLVENAPHGPGEAAFLIAGQNEVLAKIAARRPRGQARKQKPVVLGLLGLGVFRERRPEQVFRRAPHEPHQGPVHEHPAQIARQAHDEFGLILDHGQIPPTAHGKLPFRRPTGRDFTEHAA